MGKQKKGLAILLTIAMVIGMMPGAGIMQAFAADIVPEQTEDKLITDWEWVDDWEIIDPDSGNILLPFASEENVAYFEDIVEMLPTAILVGGEEVALGEWACEDYPMESGAYEGEYVFENTLPEGYVLSEDSNDLCLTVVLGSPAEEDTGVTFGGSGHTHCLCGAVHQNIGDHTAGESLEWQAWGSWGSGSAFPVESGNYYLTENVNLYTQRAGWWEIKSGITINLCLNGHQFSAGNIRLAQVDKGGKLTITDCVGRGYITAGYASNNYEHCVTNESGGEFCLFGGTLRDFNRIVENSGTFRMYGGSLCNNKGGINLGGGVYNKGTFRMYGGTIRDCSLNSISAYGGGGVYNEGTVYMSGGSITSCGLSMTSSSATVYASGSGVYNEGTFHMSGGSITENEAYAAKNVGADAYGYGFYNLGTLNLSGNANISGNVIGDVSDGIPANLLISADKPVNISGNLDSVAKISVTHANGAGTVANVAQGVTAASSCFIPDDSAWRAAKDSSGNIILKDASLVGLSGCVKVGDAFVSGATISFSQSGSLIGSCTTNSSGYYIIDIHPGTYQVSLKLPGFDQAQDKGTITLTSDIEQTHDFTMAAETLPGTMTVSYLDQNGNVQQQLCRLITENDKELTADYCNGWYAAWNTLTVGDRITVKGDVHLILMDGCNFTANDGIGVENDKSLTIYAQTQGSGTLNATAGTSTEGAAIGSNSNGSANITINGGTVNARGGRTGAGIGGGTFSKGGNITINGGTVNATGGTAAPGIGGGLLGNIGSITINGGTVNAVAGADPAASKRNICGIGCAWNYSAGSITINGGTVTAIGDLNGLGYGFSQVPTMGSSVLWKVSQGLNGNSLAGVKKAEVSDSTYTQSRAIKVEVCENHEADSDTPGTGYTHSGTCKWCGTEFTVCTYTYKETAVRAIPIAMNGNTFVKLTDVNGNEIASNNYTIDGTAGKLTLKAAYLGTLGVGKYTYKAYVKPQGQETTAVTLACTFIVDVKARELTVTRATAADRKYDTTNVVTITAVELDGIIDGDVVSVDTADLTGTLSDVNAGDYTSVTLSSELSLTGAAAGNYTLVQPTGAVPTTVTISKADAEIVNTETYNKSFGGEAFDLDVTVSHNEAKAQYEVTVGSDVVSVSAEGTVTILKAGTATITVSLPASTNYNAAENKTIAVNVAKKTGYTVDTINKTYAYKKGNTDTIDLSKLLLSDCGSVTYGTPQVTGALYTEYGAPAVSDGKLSYTVTEGDTDKTGTITVTVSSENYADFTITVNITLKGRIPVKIAAIGITDKTDSGANVYLGAIDEGEYGIDNYYLYYTIEPETNVTAETVKAKGTASPTGTFVLSGLPENTTYYLYAIAEDTYGNASAVWADSFTTWVKAPVISPAGGSYIGSVSVSLSAGDGTTIYYTTDGSEPTTESTEYTQAFTLTASATVKAIAVKGSNSSVTTQAQFTIITGGLPTTPTDNVTQAGDSTTADMTGSTVSKGGETTTTVDQTTADKLVDKAVSNNSEEVIIHAETKNESAASSVKSAEVTLPAETLGAIAEKTDADVVIKTDVAEIKLDNKAAEAIASQAQAAAETAGRDETVSISAEKVKEGAKEVRFVLKVATSGGKVISGFNGGSVSVTVNVPMSLSSKKIVCVYIDGQGHYHKVEGKLNPDGTYTFTTGHFSTYAVMEQEDADKAIEDQKEAIKAIKFKLSSRLVKTKSGKKAVKLIWTNPSDIEFEGVAVYRSTKKNSGYGKKPFATSKTGKYTNTSVKSGKKYYYKVRAFVTIDGERVYTDYSNKAWRTVK